MGHPDIRVKGRLGKSSRGRSPEGGALGVPGSGGVRRRCRWSRAAGSGSGRGQMVPDVGTADLWIFF